jgi:hypothetical protein
VTGRACFSATVWAAAAAAGCFSPQPQVGLDCTADGRCPEGQVCDLTLNECVPDSSLDTWRDDTAADFGDPSAILESATVEANGAIGPAPYFIGISVTGIDGLAIGDGEENTITWAEITSLPSTGRRAFAHALDVDFEGDPPLNIGLDRTTDITAVFEGEIYLDAGSVEFELDVNDQGVFELADASGVYSHVVGADSGGNQFGTVQIATAGWYPFRGAASSDMGDFYWAIDVGYDGDNPSSVPRDRLRTRVDGADGLLLDGFYELWLLDPNLTALSRDGLADLDFGDAPPPDLGPLGAVWAARWSGQFLVTQGGDYTFDVDTRGGHRMWIDGQLLADDLATSPALTVTEPVTLDAGWHDLVLDLQKASGSTAWTRVTVASGPELVGDFFPAERMRPVLGRGVRYSYASNGASLAIADAPAAGAVKSTQPYRPPGATPLVNDVTYQLTHPLQSSVTGTLREPSGTVITLFAAGDLTGTGAYSAHRSYANPVGTTSWQTTMTDTVMDMMVGTSDYLRVALTYAGGEAPFPTRAVYTSRIRDLGPAVAITGVRWQARQERPEAPVVVRVRSCDDPAACAAEPWTAVARSGDVAGVAARRFLQYQVELATDGDVPTALDWIEIDYRLPE